MKTIAVSDETAAFLSELATRLANQDRRGTADPYYFTVRKFVDVAVPEGCGEKVMYFDSQDCESYTEEEAKENAIEHEMEFDDYVEDRCNKYDVKEEERYENFFFTLEGYQQHIKMDGHNIARRCNKYDSYVDHAYRNPEIAGVLKAVKEIGCALRQVETGEFLTTGNNTSKTPPQGEITPSCETCLIRRSICPHSSGSEGCRSIYKSA